MKILISDPLAQEGLKLLQSKAEVDVKLRLPPQDLEQIIPAYDALVVRSETKVTDKIIQAGTRLQVIGRAGVGVDNIDVDAATRRGVVVVNAPTGNTLAAAEHTIALMLALARHIPQAYVSLKGGEWRRGDFIGVEVRNKTLGIIGLGKVGSEVAHRAKGLDMRVIAFDPFVSSGYAQNLGADIVPLDDLLKNSDFITVHTPLTESTKSLIGERELSMVKRECRFINVARGGIIDEEALFRAVEEGRVAGAAVDVFTQEPAKDNILFKSKKIIVTPHLGASTVEAQAGVSVEIAEQVLAVLEGRSARYAVNAPLVVPEALGVLAPFVDVGTMVGKLAAQLVEGQMNAITITYEGDIARYDTSILKAAVIRGLLAPVTEERINMVNAHLIATQRGFQIHERKGPAEENYNNLLSVQVAGSIGGILLTGTSLRGEVHIVQVNDYWVDIVPTSGCLLFVDHQDQPGVIGKVGSITGSANVNISFMEVGRLKARGPAIMILGLDDPLPEPQRQEVLRIPGIRAAKLVTP